jgi:nitroreductase
METLEAIATRRSIRHFTGQAVPEELIERLLRAAMQAPSAGDEQPWHFIVIRDRATLDAIPNFQPYTQMLKEAPAAIVVLGDPRLEKKVAGTWIQDCCAATENLLLAAHALGLGACWCALHPLEACESAVRELLGIPKAVTPLAVVALGYPSKEKPPADRFIPTRVHRERW